MQDKKILITGVHTTPAIAVLEELQSRGYNNFVWVGRKHLMLGTKEPSFEYKLIKEKDIKFINLITGKIQRTLDPTFFYWLIRIPVGFIQAFFIILNERPSIVVTFGSYVGVPISFWAWIFRIKIICHEQTLLSGLANNFISKFATKVCLSWNTRKETKKYVYTGNPIQKDIFESKTDDFIFTENRKHTLLFIAGKTGSHRLNLTIFNSIEKLAKHYNVIHQTGSNAIADDLAEAINISNHVNKSGIKYIPVMSYRGGEVYKKSTIVISRSGANTVYELAALGKVSLQIPIPFTQKNEQVKNAKLLENAGTAKILFQDVLTPDTLFATIREIEANYETMQACTPKAKSLIVLDAHKRIADIIESFINVQKVKKLTSPKAILTNMKNKVEIPAIEKLKEIVAKKKAYYSHKDSNITHNSDSNKVQEITAESVNNKGKIKNSKKKNINKKSKKKNKK